MSKGASQGVSKGATKYSFSLPRVSLHTQVANESQLNQVSEHEKERLNWAEKLLDIPEVWKQTMGEGVKVAVLDTGIDSDHPDLKSAIVESADFTGDGIEDASGHGTHTAGIIGARLNGVGFVGVAPKCELIIGKVLDNNGSGTFEWISEGIDWAVQSGADIISMSLGGPGSTQGLYRAIHLALAKGVHVICAAGNEGSMSQNSIGFPGRYGAVITVAAHDRNGNRSGFSSRGGELDVMAPGSNIWSTYKDGGYAELSGTSMATPFVAGLAALLISKHKAQPDSKTPVENTSDLKEHLMRMAAHPGYHDNLSGYGPLQPFRLFGNSEQ
ncbi:MAG: S8 family peptidase [Thiohalomonadales bacterium]